MQCFLRSAWSGVVTATAFAVATEGAAAWFIARGTTASQEEVVRWVTIGGWATGPIVGLLCLLLIALLNGIRRLLHLRANRYLHVPLLFAGVLPWMMVSWELVMNEPRYTPFAEAIIDLIAKPLFLSSFGMGLLLSLMFLLSLIPSKKTA